MYSLRINALISLSIWIGIFFVPCVAAEPDIGALPDNYAVALQSGHFVSRHNFDCDSDYLPSGLLTRPDEWVEIDTSSESLPHYSQEGQIDYVAWSIRGRAGR